jgi:hypothetical protein
MQNNDPKSENKALKERAAKTKDAEARLKSTAREHAKSRALRFLGIEHEPGGPHTRVPAGDR